MIITNCNHLWESILSAKVLGKMMSYPSYPCSVCRHETRGFCDPKRLEKSMHAVERTRKWFVDDAMQKSAISFDTIATVSILHMSLYKYIIYLGQS